ncbi:MAG: hypothetical protein IV107_16420 [Paucibacter sp.]|nr:hypothetical protein [Roseateles sp.]
MTQETHLALKLADDLEASSHFPGNMRSCNNLGAARLRQQHALIVQMAAALEDLRDHAVLAYGMGECNSYVIDADSQITAAKEYLK